MNTLTRIPDEKFIHAPATLAAWFLKTEPPAHPWWDSYLWNLITLADVPGVDAAQKQAPEMTHELLLVALDPLSNPTPENLPRWRHLTPVNYVFQFAAVDDEMAVKVAEAAAEWLRDERLLIELSGIEGAREFNDRHIGMLVEHWKNTVAMPPKAES